MRLREAAIVGLAGLTRRVHPRGTVRLLNLLHNPRRRPWSVHTVVATANGRFHIDTARLLEWNMLFFGFYERVTTRTIRQHIRPGSDAIDVGANVGSFSFVMSRAVGPGGRVVACEPNPGRCRRLAQNVELNAARNVTVCPVAISSNGGQAPLYIPADRDPNQEWSRLGSPAGLLGPDAQAVTVDVDTIDDLAARLGLSDVSLIKIDTEGYDAAVVAGARKVLRASMPTVVFEHSRRHWDAAGYRLADVIAELRGLGYRRFGCISGDRADCLEVADASEIPAIADVVAIGDRS